MGMHAWGACHVKRAHAQMRAETGPQKPVPNLVTGARIALWRLFGMSTHTVVFTCGIDDTGKRLAR